MARLVAHRATAAARGIEGVEAELVAPPVQRIRQISATVRALFLSRTLSTNRRPQFPRPSETVRALSTPIGQRVTAPALCSGFVGPLGGSSLLAFFLSSFPWLVALLSVSLPPLHPPPSPPPRSCCPFARLPLLPLLPLPPGLLVLAAAFPPPPPHPKTPPHLPFQRRTPLYRFSRWPMRGR